MPPRKKTETKHEFPREVCGACSFHHFEDDKQEVSLCWVDQPRISEHEDGIPVFSRGVPIDPIWPKCKHFAPRMHA